MSRFAEETVVHIHHWNEKLFSFRTTRTDSFKFRNGHFVMLGLELDSGPLTRAYSIASANYEETLEFFSIKVENGPLTSRLQNLKLGQKVIMSKKPVGTLVTDDLNPGKRLILLATGTGLAPFISITKDPEVYEKYDEIILIHSVRRASDLAYSEHFRNTLPKDKYLGELVKEKLRYIPTVTRESFALNDRITALIEKKFIDIDPASDRVMICGSQAALTDISNMLNERGFSISPGQGQLGDYVIERAFVA